MHPLLSTPLTSAVRRLLKWYTLLHYIMRWYWEFTTHWQYCSLIKSNEKILCILHNVRVWSAMNTWVGRSSRSPLAIFTHIENTHIYATVDVSSQPDEMWSLYWWWWSSPRTKIHFAAGQSSGDVERAWWLKRVCHTRTFATDFLRLLRFATKFHFRYLVVSATSLSRSSNLFARMCVLLSLANQCAMRIRSTVQCNNISSSLVCGVHS